MNIRALFIHDMRQNTNSLIIYRNLFATLNPQSIARLGKYPFAQQITAFFKSIGRFPSRHVDAAVAGVWFFDRTVGIFDRVFHP